MAGRSTVAVRKRLGVLKSKDLNGIYPKKEIDILDKCSKQGFKWDNDEFEIINSSSKH